ncbi:hypothetical protein [Pseudomonas putida]|uniref:Metallo-beta-lactamase domain-containing protein n=1 Tax=Pseudomonas putida TaxID=303 RepID=A0A1Q9R6V5_PSEPU|nr:hypothetical protein [Pseudomonas putida]OLS63088.1 hypothetical protein PSEMO_20240 [Pseudomonas putida]
MSPIRLHLFAYQVGFGDCFLLRFVYPDASARHVLIDFGTVGMPAGVNKATQMLRIANDIKDKCAGKLNALVATHRHADHISGFDPLKKGNGPGSIIRALEPDVVLQPWTEQPDLAENATAPLAAAHAQALAGMNEVAQRLKTRLDGKPKGLTAELDRRLGFLGENNIANKGAVNNLIAMGSRSGARAVYAHFGSDDPLAEVLPGIRTRVLGPPTVEQSAEVRRERRSDPEYWLRAPLLFARPGAAGGSSASPFPGAAYERGSKLPQSTRWVAGRVRAARGEQWLSIVTALDKAMNNTSLILLFEAGGKKLLFPGDAQIENWRYALNQPEIAELLASVDLYKVGHHGSLNATPKTLWNGFSKKGEAKHPGRLTSVLSTLPGQYGGKSEGAGTEVPRVPLLNELDKDSDLHDTHRLAVDVLYDEVILEL